VGKFPTAVIEELLNYIYTGAATRADLMPAVAEFIRRVHGGVFCH